MLYGCAISDFWRTTVR